MKHLILIIIAIITYILSYMFGRKVKDSSTTKKVLTVLGCSLGSTIIGNMIYKLLYE